MIFIHLFNKYLFSTDHGPGQAPLHIHKTNTNLPLKSVHSVGGDRK